MGGSTSIAGSFLGWWDRADTSALSNYAEREFVITPKFAGRPDLIAYEFYSTASLAWLVLQHNNIVDVEEELIEGVTLKIPDLATVRSSLSTISRSK